MAIYGRFGGTVQIIRKGTLEDVKTLDKRKPDKQDREAVELGSYVVVRFDDEKTDGLCGERLYHLAYLRADGGSLEISEAIEALG